MMANKAGSTQNHRQWLSKRFSTLVLDVWNCFN